MTKKEKKKKKEEGKAEFTYGALALAYCDCKRKKSNTMQAKKFEFRREQNLSKLYQDIINRKYEISKSICFVVTEPKYREVWAGAFRDRIVHHLIYNAIKTRFEKKFIPDTYSCIVGRGTLKGAQRAYQFARKATHNYRKKAYFIKMDIKNYFVSIDKNILYNEILKFVDEPWLVYLIKEVIFHDPRKNVFMKSPPHLYKKLPPHKSLFNTSADKGLPIGNLTSQFFSNVYLNPLDQYVKHVLKCKRYIRYVDDILIIDEDPGFLNYAYAKINRFLIDNLAMELNHKKKNINTIDKGFDFLGHVIKPRCTHLRIRTAKKCLNYVKEWQKRDDKYEKCVLEDFRNTVNSYFGLSRHTSGYNFRKKVADEVVCDYIKPDKDYTKLKVAS